jgi:hypothetical protein
MHLLDLSTLAAASPDFTTGLNVVYPAPESAPTPRSIRSRVARLKQLTDRREKLLLALEVLHEMLYLAECPDDFATIARLIGETRADLLVLERAR